MFSYIINDNVQLKLLENSHAEELFQLTDHNRMYLREWLAWVDEIKSVEQSRDFIQHSLNLFANHNGFSAGIFYKDRLVGCIGLHHIDWRNRKTSIGYWLSEEYQGKGIMTKACTAVIHYIFHDLSLNRVEIRAAEQNLKSRAIPERLNFVLEGKERKAEWLYDRFIDHVIYGMLQEEWNSENVRKTV